MMDFITKSSLLEVDNWSVRLTASCKVKPLRVLRADVTSVLAHDFSSSLMRWLSTAGKVLPCSECHIRKPERYLLIVDVNTFLEATAEHHKMKRYTNFGLNSWTVPNWPVVERKSRNLLTAAAYCLVVAGAQPCFNMNKLGPSSLPEGPNPLRDKVDWADDNKVWFMFEASQ